VNLSADNDGTGPGAAGGTVTFAAVTAADLVIRFNPADYTTTSAEIAAYAPKATLTGTFDARAWTFVDNSSATAQNKTYNGTTAATLNMPFTFISGPDNVTAGQFVTLGAGAANFNSKDVATANAVNFTGYGLDGANAGLYSLFSQPLSQAATIAAAPLDIAANSATRLYGDANPLFSATYSGFRNGETSAALTGTLAIATPAIPASNVGNYAIIPSGQSSPNYIIAYGNGVLGVTPVSLMVIADAQSKVYGTSDPALTLSATGLVNNPAFGIADTAGTVLSGALTRAIGDPSHCQCITCLNGENVKGGPYAITKGTLAANSNYTLGFTGNNLTITPAALHVAANPQSKIFGMNDPALTFNVTGLVNNPTLGIVDTADSELSGALTRVPGESALGGPYLITQGTLTAKCNYLLDYTQNNLIITGVAAEPILGFNAGQIIFTGIINNDTFRRPGNFWHISLNYNNADPGFDVMRGTSDLNTRAQLSLNGCDSVFGGGFCETWSFPQQRGEIDEK